MPLHPFKFVSADPCPAPPAIVHASPTSQARPSASPVTFCRLLNKAFPPRHCPFCPACPVFRPLLQPHPVPTLTLP
eukprot:2376423-Rhodomonas_salina.2